MDNGDVIDEHAGAKNPELEKFSDRNVENHVNMGEETKWWEGESQFLLDSQQLAEGMALCDELLQSQSSCGGEVEEAKRIKPCLLSEYAQKGGVEVLKKDLEECQALGLNHFVPTDQQKHATDLELLDTPDMQLSQLVCIIIISMFIFRGFYILIT